MDANEAKAMLGTEFKYIFTDGDSAKGYVKAFDTEIGLTCASLGLISDRGVEMDPDEGEDSVCLIGLNFKIGAGQHSIESALDTLDTIKKTGEFATPKASIFGRDPSCSF